MTTLRELALSSLETVRGGLSTDLRQRAFSIASERWIDALNAGSPRADKLARQMSVFGR